MHVIDDSFLLPDGQRLGYRVLGDPDGKPFFFFHGTPGSRFELVEDDAMVQFPGLKVITPERPGYGLSNPQPDRALVDWPKDVAALADHLGMDRFAVGGGSGGGPHALACAGMRASIGGSGDDCPVIEFPITGKYSRSNQGYGDGESTGNVSGPICAMGLSLAGGFIRKEI